MRAFHTEQDIQRIVANDALKTQVRPYSARQDDVIWALNKKLQNSKSNDPFLLTLRKRLMNEQMNLNGPTLSYRDWETDRKSTRLNSSHSAKSRMPSSA